MGRKCRNPELKPFPYCYVSETEWEYCFDSRCQGEKLIFLYPRNFDYAKVLQIVVLFFNACSGCS